jgi:hypothetical protein
MNSPDACLARSRHSCVASVFDSVLSARQGLFAVSRGDNMRCDRQSPRMMDAVCVNPSSMAPDRQNDGIRDFHDLGDGVSSDTDSYGGGGHQEIPSTGTTAIMRGRGILRARTESGWSALAFPPLAPSR